MIRTGEILHSKSDRLPSKLVYLLRQPFCFITLISVATMLMYGCTSIRGTMPVMEPDTNLEGSYVFHAEGLRMSRFVVAFPEKELVDFPGKENSEATWEVDFKRTESEADNLYELIVTGTQDGLRRRITLLCKLENTDENQDVALRPLLATETATDTVRDHVLLRRQSMELRVTPKGVEEDTSWSRDMRALSVWAFHHPDRLYDPEIIVLCSDYIWHHGNLDEPPGSFNALITLAYRHIELTPQVVDPYVTTAWLLWSKWVTWKNDPEKMPDGQDGVERAFRLLRQGRAANFDNADYHFESATTVMPLAQHHLEKHYDFVIKYLKLANELAEKERLRVRSRKVLGHCFRKLDKTAKAIKWYQKVLDIKPEHKIATKYLKRLQEKHSETEK